MFDKGRKYSYKDQKSQRQKILWIFLCIVIIFTVYNSLSSFFFSMRVLENNTMQPELKPGERFIFSSFPVYSFFSRINALKRIPFRRGDIVLVDTGTGEKRSVVQVLLDGAIRFFTAQRIGLGRAENSTYIKRVIALPGDEIVMTNFVMRVKTEESSYSLTEFELSQRPYEVTIPQIPALWDDSMPFSRNMETISLGPDECFVLSDDRSNTNDSRTWGPIPLNRISGRAIFRYWPLTRLGPP
ncbi:MAG: signal peptidase I [Treponema sp.]|jgi:signal peptidase I|nr:signal peptidase I [Treponema sp.]